MDMPGGMSSAVRQGIQEEAFHYIVISPFYTNGLV